MNPPVKPPKSGRLANPVGSTVWLYGIGALLGLGLLKLGNPVILDRLVTVPQGFWEWVFQPWPLSLGVYGILAWLGIGFVLGARLDLTRLRGWAWFPLVWLGWQLCAAASTVDRSLTEVTLKHFGICVLLYYAGLFSGREPSDVVPRFAWGILVSLVLVCWIGWDQHFGGLEATRRMVYEQEGWQNLPKDYLKKLSSDRIFSTLVYPNALAGAILLFAPLSIYALYHIRYRYRFVIYATLLGLFVYALSACLVWSGSKAGWLISVLMLGVGLWNHEALRRYRRWAVAAVLILGIGVFFARYQSYFQKGATSVGARFDYWAAASQTVAQRPLLGSGPGTFSVMYRAVKAPESEMALLAHNDYLEQASDSGVPGGIVYLLLFPACLVRCYRYSRAIPLVFSVWLGLFGWALQGCVEFGLYIPALSWSAFFFLGWLERASMEA